MRFLTSAQPGFETRGPSEPFRRDLLSHLNVVTLRVPPLREYAEDVPELLRYYVDRFVDDASLPFRRFSVAAQNRLRNYPWPGNIHELKNLVQRLLILKGQEEIGLEEIERELATQLPVNEPLVKQDLLAPAAARGPRAIRARLPATAAADLQRQSGSARQACRYGKDSPVPQAPVARCRFPQHHRGLSHGAHGASTLASRRCTPIP